MARYGRDFSTSRYIRRNVDEFGRGYDSDYVGGSYGYGWPGGSERGRPLEGGAWPERGQGMRGDSNWRSGGGRDRWGFGEDDWSGFGEPRGGGYDMSSGFRGRASRYGREYGPTDREMRGQRRGDYDDGFADRARRGWDRFRNEARGWLGRGYDRGW